VRVGNSGDIKDPDVGGTGLLVNPLNGHVLNVDTAEDRITLIDGTTDQVSGTVQTGDDPFTLTLNPGNGIVYVALRRGNGLATFMDPASP